MYQKVRQPEQRTEIRMMSLPAFVCVTKGYRWEFQREDLVQVFRLGKLESNETETARPRTLMVQFAGYTRKNLIMESLYKLKHAEMQF